MIVSANRLKAPKLFKLQNPEKHYPFAFERLSKAWRGFLKGRSNQRPIFEPSRISHDICGLRIVKEKARAVSSCPCKRLDFQCLRADSRIIPEIPTYSGYWCQTTPAKPLHISGQHFGHSSRSQRRDRYYSDREDGAAISTADKETPYHAHISKRQPDRLERAQGI